MKDRDLIRMALYDGIGWQRGLADAYSNIPNSPERAEALDMAKRYRSLLKRRYAVQETWEERLEGVPTISIDRLRPTPARGDDGGEG